MPEIRSEQGDLLAVHIPAVEPNKEGSKFYSADEDYIQLATHQYPAGKIFAAHQHHPVERQATLTQEVLILQEGSMQAAIFDLEKKLVASFTMQKGDVIMLLKGGHGFTVLDDNTRFIEVKNGPYLGAEVDRFRLFQ
ncbi:MAG: hypothetical protein KTR30_13095 [Saprospiraceae bacterium]|nr:hypothetical protein [Saprospiraceae bacterium]